MNLTKKLLPVYGMIILGGCAAVFSPYQHPQTAEFATLVITTPLQKEKVNFEYSTLKDEVVLPKQSARYLGYVLYADDYWSITKGLNAILGQKINDKLVVKIAAGNGFSGRLYGSYEEINYSYTGAVSYQTTTTYSAAENLNPIKPGATYYAVFNHVKGSKPQISITEQPPK